MPGKNEKMSIDGILQTPSAAERERTRDIFARPQIDPIPRIALRPGGAAEAIGVCERTIWDWIKRDPSFPSAKVGKCVLIPVDGLRNWVARRACNPPIPTDAA